MLRDQPAGLVERAGLLEQAANLGEHGRRRFAVGDQLLELPAIVVRAALERKRPEHGRPAAQHVAAERELVKSSPCQSCKSFRIWNAMPKCLAS